jgi:hypothetical protein
MVLVGTSAVWVGGRWTNVIFISQLQGLKTSFSQALWEASIPSGFFPSTHQGS